MTSNDVANLPEFPGENFFSHAATAYKEQVEARLAELRAVGVMVNVIIFSPACSFPLSEAGALVAAAVQEESPET